MLANPQRQWKGNYGCQGLGDEVWAVTVAGYGDSFGDDGNVLKLGSGNGCMGPLIY